MRIGPMLQRASCVLAACAVATAAGAQAHPGDTDMNGRVLVQLYVNMATPGSTFGHPVAGASLAINSDGVTVPVRTDAAGIASVWLRPGSYRVATTQLVEWQGQAYTWDVPVTVAPGVPLVTLTQSNAAAVVAAPSTAPSTPTTAASVTSVEATPARPAVIADGSRKDPMLATVLSFLVPGVGEMYAGAPGTGAAHFVVNLVAAGIFVGGVNCEANYSCSNGGTVVAIGLGLGLVNTIESMVDAHGQANKYNREHGAVAALRTVRPIAGVGSRGETRVGLSLAVAP